MKYYVYILLCSDNTYYTGVTNNLSRRIKEHQNSKFPNSYISKRLPIKLVYFSEFTNITIAIEKEKQLKKWSKAKKEALINGKYENLPNLAKKKF